MSVLTVHLDVGASSTAPDAVVRELASVAHKLGVWCQATISGIVVLASPHDDPDVLARNYESARERKASFVSANVIPRGVAG